MMENISCDNIGFIVKIIAKLIKFLHFVIPILLIVLIIYDIFKVVVGKADDKTKSDAFNIAAKRLIYAVIVFLIPTILIFVFRQLDSITNNSDKNLETTPVTWIDCFEKFYKS